MDNNFEQRQSVIAEAPRFEPIKAASIERHSAELYRQLLEVQLRYVDFLYQQEVVKKGSSDFIALLKNHTFLADKALEEPYKEDLTNIHTNHENDWISKTIALILEAFNDLELTPGLSPNTENPRSIGLVDYEEPKTVGYLEKYGLPKYDDMMEVHISDAYSRPGVPVGVSDSLTKLAELIINKYPETKEIVGKSWLMDTPLANRLGFKKIALDDEDKKDPQKYYGYGQGFWTQFVSKEGQIEQGRLQYLFENGKPQYEHSIAYMPVEDFLYKYLPEEMRDKEIILKEVDPSFGDESLAIRKESETALHGWDDLQEEQILPHLAKFEHLAKFLSGIGIFDQVTEALIMAKRKSLTEKELRESKDWEKLTNIFISALAERTYKDRVVVIPKKRKERDD